LLPCSIFFAITTGISGYYLHKFLREGVMPYQSSSQDPHYASGDPSAYNNPKDSTWSTEIESGNHRDSTDSVDRHTEHGGNQQEDEYALLHSTETDEGRHPGRPLSWGEERNAYGGGRSVPPYADYREDRGSIAAGVDALSPGGYDEYRREANTSAFGGATGHTLGGGGPLSGMGRQASHSGSGYSFGGAER
jgi:hypothetical protein